MTAEITKKETFWPSGQDRKGKTRTEIQDKTVLERLT